MSITHKEDLEKIAFGGILIIFGLAFTNLSSFVFMALIARVFGVEQYGIFVLGFSVFGLAASLSLFGMDKAVLRYIAPVYARGDVLGSQFILHRIIKYSVSLSILMSIGVYLSAESMAIKIFEKPSMVTVLKYFSLCIVPFVLSVLGYRTLQSIKRVKEQVITRNIIEPSVKVAGVLLLLIMSGSYGIAAAIIVLVVAFLCSTFYSAKKILKYIGRKKNNYAVSGWSDGEMISYSWPLFLTAIFSMGLFKLDVLFLGRYGQLEDVGLYGAAFQISALGVFGVTAASLVFSPYISASYQNNEHEKLHILFKTLSRWTLSLMLPFLVLVIIFPEQFLSLYGEGFSNAKVALIILIIGTTFANFAGVCGAFLEMAGHTKLVLVNTLITSVVAVVLCIILIPSYGIIGAALSSAGAVITLAMLRVIHLYRLEKVIPWDFSIYKPILASSIAALLLILFSKFFLSVTNWIEIIPAFIGYILIYIFLLNLMGWTNEDKIFIRKVISRVSYQK